VEDDRSKLDILVVKGYEFHNGVYSVSNEPGLAIHVDANLYRQQCEPQERVIA
jgi:hypothetical protein